MTLAIRFIPNVGRKFIYGPSGRAYPVMGTTVDVPFTDAETIHADQATRLMVILQHPWPCQLAAARDVRHNAWRADLSSFRFEPVKMGEHYGLGGLITDTCCTARSRWSARLWPECAGQAEMLFRAC
jgi:hypothetical protein